MNISKRVESLLIGVACVVYVAVRFWGVTDSCLWFDEIFSVHAAGHSWSGLWWFAALDLIHPPLFYALLKIWIFLGGEGLFWLRTLPVSLAILTLVPFLQICRELKLKFSTQLWALMLLAANGAMIKYAQEVRMYALLLFLSTVSVWLFSRFYFRGKNLWLLTLTNVLMVYAHYFGWFVVLSEIVVIAAFQRIKVRHVLQMFGVTLLAFLPWVFAVIKAAGSGGGLAQNIGWIERPDLNAFFQFLLDLVEPFYFQQSSVEAKSVYAISVPLLAVFAGVKLVYLLRARERKEITKVAVLSVFVLLSLTAAILISWLSPYSVWGSRHLTIVFVPASIIFAIYLTDSFSGWAARTAQITVAALIAVAFTLQVARPKPEFIWCAWNDVAAKIETQPGGKTVVAFEDLAAYHLWFALRNDPNVKVASLKGVPGVNEDTAYFLPRGFSEIAPHQVGDPLPDSFWIAYRSNTYDPTADPLAEFITAGYKPTDPQTIKQGGQTAVLVKMSR